MKFAKTMLVTAALVMVAAQPAVAASSSAQRLSVAKASSSARAATSISAVSRQDGNVPVWAIVLGVAVLGAGIYFLVEGDGTPDSP